MEQTKSDSRKEPLHSEGTTTIDHYNTEQGLNEFVAKNGPMLTSDEINELNKGIISPERKQFLMRNLLSYYKCSPAHTSEQILELFRRNYIKDSDIRILSKAEKINRDVISALNSKIEKLIEEYK